MMLDDQEMTDEWIVRVQGKEYGPADIDTLREWMREGRLLPENEARNAGAEDLWSTAAAIPGLFDVAAVVPTAGRSTAVPVQAQHRSFGQILAETFQIYRKGFFQFLGLTLLVLLPSVCSQLTTALSANRTRLGWRFARSRWGCLCLFNVRPLDSDVAGIYRGNSNSHG